MDTTKLLKMTEITELEKLNANSLLGHLWAQQIPVLVDLALFLNKVIES